MHASFLSRSDHHNPTSSIISASYGLFTHSTLCSLRFYAHTMHSINIRLGNPDTNCFVYNNILKFAKEDDHGYPSDRVMDAEMRYLDVIQDEVDILKPEVCVFLTGVNYDSDIEKKFNGVELLPVPGFEKNWLAQIKHPHLPQKSFRTYHPGRIMNSEDRKLYKKVLDKIIELSK